MKREGGSDERVMRVDDNAGCVSLVVSVSLFYLPFFFYIFIFFFCQHALCGLALDTLS